MKEISLPLSSFKLSSLHQSAFSSSLKIFKEANFLSENEEIPLEIKEFYNIFSNTIAKYEMVDFFMNGDCVQLRKLTGLILYLFLIYFYIIFYYFIIL